MLTNSQKYRHWLWMLPILFLTIFLGANYLTTDALWMDEWFTFYQTGGGPIANKSIMEIIIIVYQFLSWPPGFFLSFAAWDHTFGGVVFSDRVFSLCLGLIAVSLMYRLGKRIESPAFGLLAALIFSTSAFFVFYLHEMRPYTMYMVVVILNAFLYWTLVKNPDAGRAVHLGFMFSIMLTLYTHYIAAICVFSIGVYHVVFARQKLARDHWWRILRLWFNGCLLFTPWAVAMFVTVYNESLVSRGDPLPVMLYNIFNSFTNGLIWLNLVFLLTLRWWKIEVIKFIWLWIAIVLAVTVLVNAYADFLYHPRYVMGVLPMMVLLFAYVLLIIARWKREVAALLLGLWIGVGLIHSLSPIPFMARIPAHLTGIATSANDTIVEIGETCIQNDDVAFYGLYNSEDAQSFDVPLNNYLVNVDYTYAHLSTIVADVETHTLLFPEIFTDDFFEQAPTERLQQVTEAVDTVWIFSLPDVPLQEELLDMNNLLLDAGYTDCGAVVDRVDLLGVVYSQDEAMCQQVITSCSEQ